MIRSLRSPRTQILGGLEMSDAKSPFHRGEKEIQSRLGIQEKMEEMGRRVIRDRIPEKNL